MESSKKNEKCPNQIRPKIIVTILINCEYRRQVLQAKLFINVMLEGLISLSAFFNNFKIKIN